MTTTTSYGSWLNHQQHTLTVEQAIADAISGGDSDWLERMDTSGACDNIASEYRAAIQAALPDGLWLTGDEFIGLHHSDPSYTDTLAEFDIAAAIEAVDLNAIVERWDVDEQWTLNQVADRIDASSAKYADNTLRRWGVKAVGRQPGRGGQNLYPAEDVITAMNSRPGQGARTDLKDNQ
ncbi:hypothetical protein BX265_6207 [Streptomyces sp. TLI_235]|nr:hypothetical protein [Streptomyces sp. TLI_235]PBC71597.1 hypothetical protein BX265_6207 [Streptomyces sp. TLI_235]